LFARPYREDMRRPMLTKARLNDQVSTVLVCCAPHPRGHKTSRFAGRVHGIRLQVVPFRATPTYRIVSDWSEVSPGCIGVKCSSSDCGLISEYVVTLPQLVPTKPASMDDNG
jgi:hypothetical protein